MHDIETQEAAPQGDSKGTRGFPLWAVALSALIGLAVQFAFQMRGPRPELFPPLLADAPPLSQAVLVALLFAAVVAGVSALGGRLAGPFGALSAGLLLSLSWPALILVAFSPAAGLLTLVLLVITILFVWGGRCSTLGWFGLAFVVALLIVPLLRDSVLGTLWQLPGELSWQRMVFWREHSGLASPLPLLGATPLFALGLSSLLVLRGRREGMILTALLLVALLVWRFTDAGAALLLFVLSLLAALSGAWVDAIWGSIHLSRWRALAVLLLPALLLMALGTRLSTVDEAEMAQTELGLRLERVELLRTSYRISEVGEDMRWMRESFPTDRRVQLADAELMLARGQYREVVRIFKQLRREYPEWSATLMGAGWANFYNETYPTAERYFREILQEDPANPRALVGLGACAIYNSKDYVEAERLMMEGLALDEEIPEGHHNMALVLIKSRAMYDSEESMARLRHHARRAMELDPTNDDMRRFVRRSGWYDLLPEDERPNQVPGREEARP